MQEGIIVDFIEVCREFLTGFKKRKDERRKYAKEKVKKEEKEKRKEIVNERKRVRLYIITINSIFKELRSNISKLKNSRD